jgi:excisionase family DNA binding protein
MADETKDQILTIEESAKLLKVNLWTVYVLVSETKAPGKIFAKKVDRSWRIKREEIDQFLSEEPSGFDQISLNSAKKVSEK